MKGSPMSELVEGIETLNMTRSQLLKDYGDIIDKLRAESKEIEQILGKALGYPWFKNDPKNFPNATEADGVCVGVETSWSLAMIAADKIKELQGKVHQNEQTS